MKLENLGDALDHWKGSLIRILRAKDALVNLHVLPMVTDPVGSWTTEDFDLYTRLLSVDDCAILKRKERIFKKQGRKYYFTTEPNYDLFLDPNTGIREKESDKHIRPCELEKYLVPKDSCRLLLIYQHKDTRKNASKNKQYIEEILQDLVKRIGKGSVFAYFADYASMIFVCRDPKRLKIVHAHLRDFSGSNWNKRLSDLDSLTFAKRAIPKIF